jgi:uncharacterized protein YijF (DUF1287 family)
MTPHTRSFPTCAGTSHSGYSNRLANSFKSAFLFLLLLSLSTCSSGKPRGYSVTPADVLPAHPIYKPLPADAPKELKKFIDGAIAQVGVTRSYDPSYTKLDYPGGDVPANTGVCSDVLVRAFRQVGIDLQQEIHEDMEQAFSSYPTRWGLRRPDSNIDHRRVSNLTTYLTRQGKSVPITDNRDDYLPGDIVSWDLGGGIDHIGIVTDMWSDTEKRCLIVHNIGAGARVEDVLFAWRITGHYRYF